MLQNAADDPGERSPEDLRARYEAVLRETIETVGPSEVADRSGVPRDTIDALAAGESPEVTLEEAAAILAAHPDNPDADAITAEVRDDLMMGLSIAVLDVEAVESGINGQIEAKEIQQKIEGRFPMTLAEYALIHGFVEGRKP